MHLGDKIIITGAGSGLGKFIAGLDVDCVEMTRSNREKVINTFYNKNSTVIVHCAFNNSINIDDYYKYLDDNILLTKELTQIPHKKFIYLSSINVYREEWSAYKLSKLFAESIVKNHATNPLILRSGAILGRTMRYNTFLKILKEKSPNLSLSGESSFNYVLQEDLASFILEAIDKEIIGTYNFTSKGNITLKELSTLFESHPQFGNYVYDTPEIDNGDLEKYCRSANKTCIDIIEEFRKNYEH